MGEGRYLSVSLYTHWTLYSVCTMSCQDVKRRAPLCAGDAAVRGRARVDTAEPARRGPAVAAKVPGRVPGARQIRVCQLSGKDALEPYACCFSVYNQVSIRRVHRIVDSL